MEEFFITEKSTKIKIYQKKNNKNNTKYYLLEIQ